MHSNIFCTIASIIHSCIPVSIAEHVDLDVSGNDEDVVAFGIRGMREIVAQELNSVCTGQPKTCCKHVNKAV